MSDPTQAAAKAVNAAGDGMETTGSAAKQGGRGMHAFRILIGSLLLVLVALFGIYALNAGHKAAGGGARENPAAGRQFDQPAPSPKQPAPAPPATSTAPAPAPGGG